MKDVVRTLVREWRADRVSGLAAEVAFFGLLSAFPLLLAMAAILGSLESIVGDDLAADARREVVGLASRVLTDDADTVRDAIESLFAERRPGVVTGAALGALWSASRGFHSLLDALRVVNDVEETRSWLHRRLLALALAGGSIVVGAAALAGLVAGPLLGTGQDVADAVGAGEAFATVWDVARWPVVALVLIAWVATILHVSRADRLPWRKELPGALAAGAWSVAATVGLRVYLHFASGTNPVLGTLGGSIVVVLWLYLLATGVLVAGELNRVLAQRRP